MQGSCSAWKSPGGDAGSADRFGQWRRPLPAPTMARHREIAMKAALFALTVALVATPAWALDDKAICQAPSGSGYAWNGQVDACTRLLNGWSMTTEDRATTHFNRARAYYDGEQFSAAITDYSEAIRLDPGRATAWYSRGAVYSAMKIYTQAIANYDEAIRLNPS